MRDLALQAAGALAILVAIAHGAIAELYVFSRAQIEPRGTRRLLRMVWQASTVDWIGVGVLLIAALSVANGGDYRAANVTKNLVGSLNNLVAAIVFATQGAIAWGPALIVASGAIGGGLAGAHMARILPVGAARGLVIAFGALLTAIYAWRYWL